MAIAMSVIGLMTVIGTMTVIGVGLRPFIVRLRSESGILLQPTRAPVS